MRPSCALAALAVLLSAGPAAAHGSDLGKAGPDWWAVLPMTLFALLYGGGLLRLARRSRQPRRLLPWGLWAGAGLAITAAAVLGPLADHAGSSFTLHMVEHELLMLAAAPCLALARPGAVLPWSLPRPLRRPVARGGGFLSGLLSQPVPATLWQAVALWLWHAPGPFGAALAGAGWHAAQHASFLLTALFFWQAMLGAARTAQGSAVAALCLFATSVQSGLLGTLLTVAASPWYAGYRALSPPFGLTPLEDQQLAGLLMWVPGGALHAAVALAILARWLKAGGYHAPAA